MKNKGHIERAESLRHFLKPEDWEECLKETFLEKEYSDNDNICIPHLNHFLSIPSSEKIL